MKMARAKGTVNAIVINVSTNVSVLMTVLLSPPLFAAEVQRDRHPQVPASLNSPSFSPDPHPIAFFVLLIWSVAVIRVGQPRIDAAMAQDSSAGFPASTVGANELRLGSGAGNDCEQARNNNRSHNASLFLSLRKCSVTGTRAPASLNSRPDGPAQCRVSPFFAGFAS